MDSGQGEEDGQMPVRDHEEGLGKGLGMGDALKKILWVLLQQKAFWNKRLALGFRLNSSRNQLV